MKLFPFEAHIWTGSLAISPKQEADYRQILSADEIERASHFKFPRDRRRFIAARSMLRHILSSYINKLPSEFVFKIGEHGKPFLSNPKGFSIEFNVSHSGELAIYAFNLTHAIGIDIEEMHEVYPRGVTEKYFSPSERKALFDLPAREQYKIFYRLWASKEALIKATGKGLFISLSNISISHLNETETIVLENTSWSLRQLSIHPDYQAALACHPSIKDLSQFTYQHV